MSPSLLQSTLFLLIPLFSIALTVLACSHSPGPLQPQAFLAYIYIASVTLLSSLAGVLPLSHSSNNLSESLIQGLLFLFIGIPVLHLAPTYVPHLSIRKLHTFILVITLSIATLFALISPFLPTATPLLYISPSLFLLYTIQSIPSIAYILNNFLHPEDSSHSNPTISLTLPSPASTASFPEKLHHKIPSISTTSTITIADRTRRITFPSPPQDQLRSQILNSRSRSLLVFILAVQIASLAANACALGVAISARHNSSTLKTIQTACTVLALTGSMSAYLLHAYNLHLRKTPSSTDSNYNDLSTARSDSIALGLNSPSSPDTPYSNVPCNDGAISVNTNMPVGGNTLLRKRSSFFGWEFAWDQEALERADYAGKLRSTVGNGGSPGRWKSDLNPSSSEKIQPSLIVDRESFTDLDEDLDLDEDADLHMKKMRNDIERLSSLPPVPPLPPLLLPSTTRTPSQSQSLPPTPTKSQPTFLPSITGFKKRSAPPALPPLTMPKPSIRLSSMKMDTVRNAFAGVGAKVSARMSISSASTRSSAGGVTTASNPVASSVGMGMDDIDGDFMNLRDPFAPPPPSKLGSAWGRLPIPPSSTLHLPAETSNGRTSLEIANRKKAHSYHGERRKHKKEKRERKGGGGGVIAGGVLVETNSSLHGYGLSAPCSAGEEDADFGVEEALLSQRLLRRLDSVSFEWD